MFGHDAWDFVKSLVDVYGPAARIHGFLRVRTSLIISSHFVPMHQQTPWLHVSDVKGIHSVLIKDQDSYGRSSRDELYVARLLLCVPFHNTTFSS